MSINKKKIYFVIGPTASGKTDLAIELVSKLGKKSDGNWLGEIVGADSRQLFKGFDLTSGKATFEELHSLGLPVVHHLLSCVAPGNYFSVVDYKNLALPIIEDIWARGGVPVVCGGTGQYVDTIYFKEDLPDVPHDENLRSELNKMPLQDLQEKLKKLDTEAFSRIDVNNKVRLVRAIEIAQMLGKVPKRQLQQRFGVEVEVAFINTTGKFDRDTLRARIEKRFRKRLDDGMVEEMRRDKELYGLTSKYLENLGLEYRYLSQYIDGKISYELMVQLLVFETRKYARRQETWFRKYLNL
jgi:tRNA dimethylallyltransferase